jgi:selenide,water dikinase
VLFDPQTSGGLLLAVPPESAEALLDVLLASGHRAAEVGEVLEGPARIEVV